MLTIKQYIDWRESVGMHQVSRRFVQGELNRVTLMRKVPTEINLKRIETKLKNLRIESFQKIDNRVYLIKVDETEVTA